MNKGIVLSKVIGYLAGLILIVGAIISIFVIDWKTDAVSEPLTVRPLKTMVIESAYSSTGRKYPGKVSATTKVEMSFDVAGAVIEKLVSKGDEVVKDQLLFRLDPRDYKNNLDATVAEQKRAQAHLERIQKAAKTGAVSKQEVTDAQAAFEVAKAQVKIKAKALDDTSLRARFDGVIANTFVDNFENVQAKQPILSLQDVSSVDIDIYVPEERVALSMKDKDKVRFAATFEYLPDRKFEVVLGSFSTEADPVTQTFAVTFSMPAPSDVTILPGMTATITPYRIAESETEETVFAVPLDIVPVDGLGNYFLWKVVSQDDGTWSVHRANVKVGEMIGNDILVVEGLKKGERIAAAGVHLLEENQPVRLLVSNSQGKTK